MELSMIKYTVGYGAVIGIVFVSMNILAQQPVPYVIRKAVFSDKDQLMALYKRTTAVPGRLARTPAEITDEYVTELLSLGINRGVMLVVESDGQLIGAMTKYRVEPRAFAHVLTSGNILVDTAFQGKGIGMQLITTFLREIELHHTDVLRVEILARESNPAIKLYKQLGFVEEGRFEKRVRAKDGGLEADIQLVWMNPQFNGDE